MASERTTCGLKYKQRVNLCGPDVHKMKGSDVGEWSASVNTPHSWKDSCKSYAILGARLLCDLHMNFIHTAQSAMAF